MRRRTQSPPSASPRMKANSISSKAWVELPSTRLSMRIQPISYMKDETPVKAATSNSSASDTPASFAAGAGAVL